MSFSADWLTTRRDADQRARAPEIASRLTEHFENCSNLQILDLGCGTGANLAATSRLLPNGQHWTLVDNDPELLQRIEPVSKTMHTTIQADLAKDLDSLFAKPLDLITASALFDLAGTTLIDKLVEHTSRASAVFFTVLTYDGEEEWLPATPQDEAVLKAFHADQHAEKGLGPALGPDATAYLKARFTDTGYTVFTSKSDWVLSRETDQELIQMLADGIHAATVPALDDISDTWRASRESAEAVRIGHKDLIAIPPFKK